MKTPLKRNLRNERYLSKAYRAYRNRVHMHHYGKPYSPGYILLNAFSHCLANNLYLSSMRMGFSRRVLSTPEEKAASDSQCLELKLKQERAEANRKAVRDAYKADLQPYNRKLDWTTRGIYPTYNKVVIDAKGRVTGILDYRAF